MKREETKDKIIEAFKFRHACKEFDTTKKVSDTDFEFILETGRLSPSSLGLEPWNFVILQNKELREKLRGISWGAQGQLPTASHYVVLLARNKNEMTYNSDYIDKMMKVIHNMPNDVAETRKKKIEEYQKYDARMFETENGVFDWACKQVYIAMGNMMTAAAMIGIDSCPIEGYNRAEAEKILVDAGILDKNKFGIACMVAFGYRLNNPKREKTRQNINNIVKWIK